MKLVITILFVLFWLLSYSQMMVTDIKTEKDLRKFVKTYYSITKQIFFKIKKFEAKDFISEGSVHNVIDSLQLTSLLKMDLNRDGIVDMIFCGNLSNTAQCVAFVSNREHTYNTITISNDYTGGNEDKYLVKQLNDSLISLVTIPQYRGGIMIDTLFESNYFFTEYNHRNRIYPVDSVFFTFSAMSGIKTICMSRDGLVSCYLPNGIDSTRKFSYNLYQRTISKDSIDILIKYISHLPLYNYHHSYEGGGYNGFTWITSINLENCGGFNIFDHMGVAPYGLRFLYNYVYTFFEKNDWNFVKKINQENTRQVFSYACPWPD